MNTVSAYNPFASGVDERIKTRRPNFTSAFTNFRTGVSNRIDTVWSWTGGPNIPSHGEGVNGRIETQASYNTIDGATSSSPSYEAENNLLKDSVSRTRRSILLQSGENFEKLPTCLHNKEHPPEIFNNTTTETKLEGMSEQNPNLLNRGTIQSLQWLVQF
ncbi:hypothetical protein P8452_30142 [Trifolium repens]|nr:hypothetical protein P8452_30142 [Trifolium repens]